ncbi:conserved hypothetical protein [delta proteobacterium NaphS2]|nr:conserved hypothetical protein [delta proteobacterium NaphS2]
MENRKKIFPPPDMRIKPNEIEKLVKENLEKREKARNKGEAEM